MPCEIVTVVRKDHPYGRVDINKSDMTKDDVIWKAEKKEPEKKGIKQEVKSEPKKEVKGKSSGGKK